MSKLVPPAPKKDRLNRFDPRIWKKNHMDLSMVNFWCGLAAEFKHKSPSHAAWILPICPKPPPKVTDCVMPGASKRRGRIGFFRFDNSSNTIGYSIHLASNSEKIKNMFTSTRCIAKCIAQHLRCVACCPGSSLAQPIPLTRCEQCKDRLNQKILEEYEDVPRFWHIRSSLKSLK